MFDDITTVVLPRWKREFPDIESLPPIPAGWEDVSWRNDECPCFELKVDGKASLFIYVEPRSTKDNMFSWHTVYYAPDGQMDNVDCIEHTHDWNLVLKSIEPYIAVDN